MNKPSPNDACLRDWLEMIDLETPKVEGSSWVPLHTCEDVLRTGDSGYLGFREEIEIIETLIVPLHRREELKDLDWEAISRNGSDRGWADQDGLVTPGLRDADADLRFPVLVQSHDTGEDTEWHLFQELQLCLNLTRIGDEWISHAENDLVVARLKRSDDGELNRLEIRSEHLRDYLCAKQATLLITVFRVRKAVGENSSLFGLPQQTNDRIFDSGHWDGSVYAIHEGGRPFGMVTAVMNMWRESVDPETDNPTMPEPWNDTTMRSETSEHTYSGRKLWVGEGRLWTKAWLEPATISPRVRRDEVASTIHFLVDNQEQKTLAGSALAAHLGWLHFKPAVIPAILREKKAFIKWHTRDTGTIGPDTSQTLHFGVNGAGLINVVAYKMAALPMWTQKLWVAHNTQPEGGLSQELHMSQNLAKPARTFAPERALAINVQALSELTEAKYGASILRGTFDELAFFKTVHRFHGDSFESYCRLCKELHRNVSERIDIGVINDKIDSAHAQEANKQKLREIRRLAFWLDNLGHNGREMTKELAAVCDLRVGDAHAGKSDLRDSLPLLGIPADAEDLDRMCLHTIGLVANAVGGICEVVSKLGNKTE